MSQTLHFRTACQDDIPRLLTLINTAYQAPWAKDIGMPDVPRVTVDSLCDDLARTDGCIVVGEQNGQLVVVHGWARKMTVPAISVCLPSILAAKGKGSVRRC